MTSPSWLDRHEYPFQQHSFVTPHGTINYLDEGAGEVILFVHGNPTWSFEHRHLIRHLRNRYRCIALDHLGFGLSDKPQTFSYLPQEHARNLERLIEFLGLTKLTLVIHDWGGPIGMSYALDHPDQIKRMIVYNTWFWPVQGFSRTLVRFSQFVGGSIGQFLCRQFNFFPRVLMPTSVGQRQSLPPHIHRHYLKPFAEPTSRKGTWVFPGAITGQREWLESLWNKREALRDKPFLFLWGMKDNAFTADFLVRWENSFPRHQTYRFPEIGHFVAEELADQATHHIDAFLANNH